MKTETKCVALGISTSLGSMKLAASFGGKTFTVSKKYLNQEEILFGCIKNLLDKTGADLKDVKVIYNVNGPGRFTGMRISYTFCEVMRAVNGSKVRGVTILDCMVYNFIEKNKVFNGEVAAVCRAFKDEFYLKYYEFNSGKMREETLIIWLKRLDLSQKLKKFKGIVLAMTEDDENIYSAIEQKEKSAFSKFGRLNPKNIIPAALYFKRKDHKPLYIKPAKYEISNGNKKSG